MVKRAKKFCCGMFRAFEMKIRGNFSSQTSDLELRGFGACTLLVITRGNGESVYEFTV